MSHYLGVDPGKTGAVCLIKYPKIQIFDWDGVINTSAQIKHWAYHNKIKGAFIEHVHAMHKDVNHIVSMSKLIRNAGQWEGIICTLDIKIKLISPKQWRKGLYPKGSRRPLKQKSLDAARALFTDVEYFSRASDHNRAEAALIAYQAERYFDNVE